MGKLTVPPCNADRQERAKYHALVAFRNQIPNHFQISNFRFFLKAALIVSAGVALALLTRPRPAGDDGKIIAQLSQLFPNQLTAVIERDGDTRIVLAERADPSLTASQPLLLSLRRGGELIRVLSFSGRVVRLQLDGKEVSLETLLTGGGRVIVSGDQFFWSHENPGKLLGYNIQAQPLIAKL
ncbi:MAG: hypothetical protein LBD30_01960 [Verrucomicrobiales bacterium]|nr:hypothetical protein [Verrucomicrobiales bacterium]